MLLLQCCALLKFLVVDDQSMCDFMQLTRHRALVIRLGSIDSIHSQWESKQSWLHTCSTCTCVIATWAQLFEGRLALNGRLNLTKVSFSCVQKHFLGQFSLLFLQLPIINLYTKRITCKAEMLLKASYLNSNLALTLGYLSAGDQDCRLLLLPTVTCPIIAFIIVYVCRYNFCYTSLYKQLVFNY